MLQDGVSALNKVIALALMGLAVVRCAPLTPPSELLQLSHLDETLVDLEGLETQQVYDPIVLLQQGEAHTVKGDDVAASEAYQRFLELYPLHRLAAFAHYALGVSYMNQVRTSDRDPTPIVRAGIAFRHVLTRYPETPYAAEAAQRIKILTRQQAEYQLGIGRYYYKQKAYHAAIPRFEKGLKMDDPETSEQILYYLGLSYVKSGNPEKAKQVFDALRTRHPHSKYLRRLLLSLS